jgi:hypothetical protein
MPDLIRHPVFHWIPASAGMTGRAALNIWLTESSKRWIPVFTGMTKGTFSDFFEAARNSI